MAILAGTADGIVRFDDGSDDRVLDAGTVTLVRRLEAEGLFAAGETGLHRSTDDGERWEDLAVPRTGVHSVASDPEGERLYAGTWGATLYTSDDGGGGWSTLVDRDDLPGSDGWATPHHQPEPRIRSVGVHPDAPLRLLLGIEVGGVYCSDDRGGSWSAHRDGVHDDVHHLLVDTPDRYVASTGTGLYLTRDAGRSWTRLDRRLPHRYVSESIAFRGALYAGIARGPPGEWDGPDGADGTLVRFDADNSRIERVAYPGEPEAVISAWADDDGDLIAGTNDGRLLRRVGSDWQEVGSTDDDGGSNAGS
jgi:hypothetical protein